MKIYLHCLLGILITAFLTSCALYDSPPSATDLTKEIWQQSIATTPGGWTEGADHWFFTGDPNGTERINRNAPDSAAITTTMVRVSDFTKIKTNGAYQLQIFGTDDDDSVYVFGPNEGVSAVTVKLQEDTLIVTQTNQEVSNRVMNGVIVRIGIHQLNQLVQRGCGTVEAIRIQTDSLSLISKGRGNIYMIGHIGLKRVVQDGAGKITVLGVASPELVIRTSGSGSVNLMGNVGVSSIVHHGSSEINIIGANSNHLNIYTDGSGKMGIHGIVNLAKLTAKEDTCVYITEVRSHGIEAEISGNAHVGLKGVTQDLYVKTFDSSRFWGRYLCSANAYVTACNQSHSNITACTKAFASASNQASIYFYGPANLLSHFATDEASIIAMGDVTWCNLGAEYRPYSYTYAHRGEAVAVYQEVDLSARSSWHRRANPTNYIK